MHKLKRFPFEAIAATGYLIANGTLTFQGLIEGRSLLPSITNLSNLDSSSWQSIAGLLFLLSGILIYWVKKFPHNAIIMTGILQVIGNICLLTSGYTQAAFLYHAIGLIPSFLAAFSMLQGNKINDKKTFFARYPVATSAGLFILAIPPLLYNAILSQDWTLTFVIVMWFTSHIFFALTDRNLQKKIWNS